MSAALDLDHLAHLPAKIRNSKPNLFQFSPKGILYQHECLKLVRRKFDYQTGNLEILLSGSYGSAKSVLMAHLAVTHAMMFKRSRIAIVRRALPDLKATLFKEILEHLEAKQDGLEDGKKVPRLVEGKDYTVNHTRASIKFRNGSEIVPVYWSDRRYKRVRSLKLSMVIIEEGAENDDQDKEGFEEIKARLRRLPHVPENVLVVGTNPDSPAHWLYDYFIAPNSGKKQHATRHVFYSRTEQNIYLPPIYIQGLRTNMDARRARRYLDGEWIELTKDQVYYAYSVEENYRPTTYEFNPKFPIRLSWDFNIGIGKPLSVAIMQYVDDVWHCAQEVVIDGMRTQDSLDELADRGILDLECPGFIVHGDAAGKHKDTRNRRNDYEIIMDFLENYKTENGRSISVRRMVPLANPTIRARHNRVNAYCFNKMGQRRLFVYADAPTIHQGLRLVELKKGSDYQEDDSKRFQHVTTAVGYAVHAVELYESRQTQQGTRSL